MVKDVMVELHDESRSWLSGVASSVDLPEQVWMNLEGMGVVAPE